PTGIRFESSVIAELLYLLKWMRSTRAEAPDECPEGVDPGLPVPAGLARRVAEFWGDDVLYWELFIVAGEAGALVGLLAPAEIESRLGHACDSMPLQPLLRSESDDDRVKILERLQRLHDDRRLRSRYLRLIAEVWAVFESDWTARQLPAIERAAADCTAHERRGQPWQSLLKGANTAKPILDAGWERARQSGSTVVAICAYGGSLVIDLPDGQFFAMSIKDRATTDRARAAELARRLRAVADPTRLSLVELIARQPRSVGELAVELVVSQPTVSNHLKLLREAGLVRSADGQAGRRKLVVDTEALASLFHEIEALINGR
ncbi:MAG: ArsR/SmtB family transcription factor, partial [Acidimicrobiales bacterium]